MAKTIRQWGREVPPICSKLWRVCGGNHTGVIAKVAVTRHFVEAHSEQSGLHTRWGSVDLIGKENPVAIIGEPVCPVWSDESGSTAHYRGKTGEVLWFPNTGE